MVTAKFKVSRISAYGEHIDKLAEKLENDEPVQAEVELTPDYAQGKNSDWATATPCGVVRLTIANPAALKQFIGDGYGLTGKTVDITMDIT